MRNGMGEQSERERHCTFMHFILFGNMLEMSRRGVIYRTFSCVRLAFWAQ